MPKQRPEATSTQGGELSRAVKFAYIVITVSAVALAVASVVWNRPAWLSWALAVSGAVVGALGLLSVTYGQLLRQRWEARARSRRLAQLREERRHPERAQRRERTRERRSAVATRTLHLALAVGVVWGAWYALRNVLDTYQTRGSVGPTDAGDIIVALGGGSAIATGVAVFVVRLMRGYGTMRKESGAGAESRGKGAESRGKGDAELIRANAEADKIRAEGEAIVIKANAEADAIRSRARAEERRADADYLRAERGVELPPSPDAPPAIGPAPNANGSPGIPSLPAPPGDPDLT
ncbi:hypothetical protein [Streptomyces sp. NPDC056464]|uniref:LapA family protein n=1 Tax=Streptomyces sp. NPDC056464 TaxID=3345828 RepID=UPI003690BA97